MAWERRKGTSNLFFYEARRAGPKVVKVYRGAGEAAQMAARRVAKKRAEREQAARATLELVTRTCPAEVLLDQQYEAVLTLAAATLFAAGYWRPGRHHWRVWRESLRELRATG